MSLVRWEPFRELTALQNEMNRLFGTFFERDDGMHRWAPAMDLVETDTEFVLTADLPGMSEEDVKIEVRDDVLTVSGERKTEAEGRKEGYYRVERSFGSFSRSVRVPQGVDPAQIKARFDRGVLEVRVPKPREPEAHRIGIEGGGTVEGKATER